MSNEVLELREKVAALQAALVPFANAARSHVVMDAISFGGNAPELTILRGRDYYKISPWAFVDALRLT